ncbi:hypothetical protein [uncultured Pseudodesulfovibrio sp.]|uniref:hypothetical protein n=1 Tax=uncultured Pseudodesulfovibrio sp. TaxID=2035858 RepID=UPI0029C7743F|nr:hypothetical protein [uncultured Pseudodesulfovibrio sp.]
MTEDTIIHLRCLFCEATKFEMAKDFQPKEGDTLKCANCGRENPYELLMEACREEAQNIAKDILSKKLSKIKF